MARKPSLIDMDIGAEPEGALNISAEQTSGRGTINLTVDVDLKYEFKEWCARHRTSQVNAFRKAFDLLKEREGQ
jgi:hypothetical protein